VSFIQLIKSEETDEIMNHPREFLLLTLIAYRAKRTNSFSAKGLEINQALIGDYKSCGLTERKYRTAKNNLSKWGFVTFESTSKGTIATIINTTVYDINSESKEGKEGKKKRVCAKKRAE